MNKESETEITSSLEQVYQHGIDHSIKVIENYKIVFPIYKVILNKIIADLKKLKS